MTIIFTQTDSSATTCGQVQACAGSVVAPAAADRLAVDGGTAGSTPISGLGSLDSGIQRSVYMVEMAPAATDWASGTSVVRVNVSGGNKQMNIQAVYLCQRSSSCGAIATYGSLTAIGQNIQTAQVYSFNVTCSTIVAATSDLLYCVVELDSSAGMAQTFTVTPDQDIDTPINAPGVAPGQFLRRYAHMPAPNPLLRM